MGEIVAHSSATDIVRSYFAEVVDNRDISAIDRLFAEDCRIFRADRSTPIVGRDRLKRFFRNAARAVPSTQTTIEAFVVDENGQVAARVHHIAEFGPLVLTPIGPAFNLHKAGPVEWRAMAMFEVNGGVITSQFVIRDEVSILRQMGLMPRTRTTAFRVGLRQLFGFGGKTPLGDRDG